MKRILIPIVVIILITIISIVIVFNGNIERDTHKETIKTPSSSPTIEKQQKTETVNWQETTLKDIRTQETYTIKDSEKVIVLETFAVWCPTCKQQQDQIKKLIEQGDKSIHISINTDPNEDASQVIEHANNYNFDWRFAISPIVYTQLLITEFGIKVVNAPSAPVILICEDLTARLLGSGVKDTTELKEEIAKGCT